MSDPTMMGGLQPEIDERSDDGSDPVLAAVIALAADYEPGELSEVVVLNAELRAMLEDFGHRLVARLRRESLLPLPYPFHLGWVCMLGVLTERLRQAAPLGGPGSDVGGRRGEGFDAERDDEYVAGELALAAACYGLSAAMQTIRAARCNPTRLALGDISEAMADLWPWDPSWWKPKTPDRDLERAGALILAELERRARAAADDPEAGDAAT